MVHSTVLWALGLCVELDVGGLEFSAGNEGPAGIPKDSLSMTKTQGGAGWRLPETICEHVWFLWL